MPETGDPPIRVYRERDIWHVDFGEESRKTSPAVKRLSLLPTRFQRRKTAPWSSRNKGARGGIYVGSTIKIGSSPRRSGRTSSSTRSLVVSLSMMMPSGQSGRASSIRPRATPFLVTS